MSFKDVKKLLDVHLNLIAGGLPVAWENIKFTPILNEPWIRPTLINGTSENVDLNSNQLNPGIFRVDVFYPLGVGEGNLFEKIDEIYIHFKKAILSVDDTIINIQDISLLPRLTDEPWIMGSLDINFVNYEFASGSFTPPQMQGSWITVSSSRIVSPGSLYISTSNTSRVVFTLPPVCEVGDYFRVAGYGSAGWRIQANTGQIITYGDQQTSVGGYLESIDDRDCIELVCVIANSEWQELSSQGNITIN